MFDMKLKQMHFLAGLPRSGTTLLGAIFSQNPNLYGSATSPLPGLMASTHQSFEQSQFTTTPEMKNKKNDILKGLTSGLYSSVKEDVIIEKNRAWSYLLHIQTMEALLERKVKVICPVRPIADVLASFVSIMNKNGGRSNLEKEMQMRGIPLTDKGRCDFLMDPKFGTVRQAYDWMKQTFQTEYKDRLFFIEYDDLIAEPQKTMDSIYEFLEIPSYKHDFENIIAKAKEDDEISFGLPGLHEVRLKLEKRSRDSKQVLGEKIWSYYQGGEFWNDKPEPTYEKSTLDLQLEASLRGDFETGWKYCQQADPADDRAQFNKGWYLLQQGKLLEGSRLLDRGRNENIFGSPRPSPMPIWDGRPLNGEWVLLNGEGGFGDQICHARFAKDIEKRGGRVILACRKEIAPVLAMIDGVSAVVDNSVAALCYHHYIVPAMSAVCSLKYEYNNLNGAAYIPSVIKNKKNKKPKVGIRWAGDPRMQHDHFRRFDPQHLFNLPDVDLVSLQKDWDSEIPMNIQTPSLETWIDTYQCITDLDLVISSCTSVAHLAAAMGKPTWLIVPILPYYLWALPGSKSPWYDAMTIYRQETPMQWDATFNKLNGALSNWVKEFSGW